jgi:hypothetical protein
VSGPTPHDCWLAAEHEGELHRGCYSHGYWYLSPVTTLMLAPEIYVPIRLAQRRQTTPAALAQARAGPNVAATIGASERLARGRGVQTLNPIAHSCATTGIKPTVFVSSSHAARAQLVGQPQVGTAEPRKHNWLTSPRLGPPSLAIRRNAALASLRTLDRQPIRARLGS